MDNKLVDQDGFCVIENFLSEAEIEELRSEMHNLVEAMPDEEIVKSVFSTTTQEHRKSNYFLESSDKIQGFLETEALDETGSLKTRKQDSVNKVGHALHALNPVFKQHSSGHKVQGVLRSLGFKAPAVIQSMYIFKPPHFGGEVTSHQDATFLSTSPGLGAVLGLWIALEDVDEENACLWMIPGSHKTTAVSRRFVRHSEEEPLPLRFEGEEAEVDHSQFISVPVAKGSCILISNCVVHKSNRNTSSRSRHAYTLHVAETRDTTWSTQNWLQPSQDVPFTPIYEA